MTIVVQYKRVRFVRRCVRVQATRNGYNCPPTLRERQQLASSGRDNRTRGPEDQRTTGPEDQSTRRPGKMIIFYSPK